MTRIRTQSPRYFLWILAAVLLSGLLVPPAARARLFGEDIEKPKPVFTRQGDTITARLIPRAKSTSVDLRFKVAGATLSSVEGVDFFSAERPEVDVKNFKSALFAIHAVDVPLGGTARFSVISDFFNSATAFYVFNEKQSKPWVNSMAENISLPNLVQELVITVKDGGPLDSDGAADGKITLVGGPRDSFWGYALGTLFIRFFGIFIVLGLLMIGLLVSGKVFQYLDARAAAPVPKAPEPPAAECPAESLENSRPSDLEAAAIAVALALHLNSGEPAPAGGAQPVVSETWRQAGRAQLMTDRLEVFHRRIPKGQ
jgi:hypothetical protein